MVANIVLSAVREVVSRDKLDHRFSQYVIKGAQIFFNKGKHSTLIIVKINIKMF